MVSNKIKKTRDQLLKGRKKRAASIRTGLQKRRSKLATGRKKRSSKVRRIVRRTQNRGSVV